MFIIVCSASVSPAQLHEYQEAGLNGCLEKGVVLSDVVPAALLALKARLD